MQIAWTFGGKHEIKGMLASPVRVLAKYQIIGTPIAAQLAEKIVMWLVHFHLKPPNQYQAYDIRATAQSCIVWFDN